jgi:hypothetical protein
MRVAIKLPWRPAIHKSRQFIRDSLADSVTWIALAGSTLSIKHQTGKILSSSEKAVTMR